MYSQQNVRDENGESIIPASQRPDGTWRKARRVKEGYVPQEEVPLYESKGKQFANRSLKPADPTSVPEGHIAHKTIPGLFIVKDVEKPKNKKKSKKTEEVLPKVEQIKITEEKKPKPAKEPAKNPVSTKTNVSQTNTKNNDKNDDSGLTTDPAKKLKNLKKRVREIEALEEKLKKGDIQKPEPEQLIKIKRKPELLMQISALEKQL